MPLVSHVRCISGNSRQMQSLLDVLVPKYLFSRTKVQILTQPALPGGGVEGKSKTEKSEKASVKKEVVKKDVSHLDETIKQWEVVEVYTAGDWWDARIERIVQVQASPVQKYLLY